MVQLKSHTVKVAMKMAPLSEADIEERYRKPEALGMTKLSAAPVGVDDDDGGGRGRGEGEWFEVELPWLWAGEKLCDS